jgi:hypothetical protein
MISTSWNVEGFPTCGLARSLQGNTVQYFNYATTTSFHRDIGFSDFVHRQNPIVSTLPSNPSVILPSTFLNLGTVSVIKLPTT